MEANVENVNFQIAAAAEKRKWHDVEAHVHTLRQCCQKSSPIIHLGTTSCYTVDNKLIPLLCVLCFLAVPGQAAHEFNLGKNVTLDFHHELKSPNSTYFFVVRLDGSTFELYVQDQLNPPGLRPGQAGRVDVKEDQSQRSVIITISFYDVQRIDEGLYIVSIVELNDDTVSSHDYQTYLDVTYPPERADCHIENPPIPSADWLAVRCNATVGNDNTGYLMCYQNSRQVPYLEPVRHIDKYMTGLFWMDPTTELRCCSTYNESDVDIESCNDFVQPSSDGSMSSDKPHLITKALSSASPSITADDTDQHNGISGEVNAVLVVMSVVGSVVIVLLLAAAVYMYRKKEREKNNKGLSSHGGRQPEDEEQPLGAQMRAHAPIEQTSNGSVVFVNNRETC